MSAQVPVYEAQEPNISLSSYLEVYNTYRFFRSGTSIAFHLAAGALTGGMSLAVTLPMSVVSYLGQKSPYYYEDGRQLEADRVAEKLVLRDPEGKHAFSNNVDAAVSASVSALSKNIGRPFAYTAFAVAATIDGGILLCNKIAGKPSKQMGLADSNFKFLRTWQDRAWRLGVIAPDLVTGLKIHKNSRLRTQSLSL